MVDGVTDEGAVSRDIRRRPALAVVAGEDEKPRSAHAIIVGINRYEDTRIPSLRYARADAEALYGVLTDKEYGTFPAANVTLLVDENATRDNIITEIGTNLPRRLDENDTVCLFFAGHGAPEPSSRPALIDGTEKYLLPFEANIDRLRATAISMEEVRKWFEWVAGARQVIFFIDSCYSGQAGGRLGVRTIEMPGVRAGLSDSFLTALGGEARFVLTACGPNEVAIEDPAIKHGIFTNYLVEGLSGKADRDGDGLVSANELFEYVGDQVQTHARKLLGQMTPLQSGQVQGKVILSRVRGRGQVRPADSALANALDPATFEAHAQAVHCVIVQREARDDNAVIPLHVHVRRALDYHGADVKQAVARYRRATQPGRVDAEGPASIVPSTLSIAEAFDSEAALVRAVQAMCRADAVVFDITDFEPGVMMLLGIRSVARRGVTVCSLGGGYVLGSEFSIPFNLQLLNLASHSRAQKSSGLDPRSLLGSKLARGFREMAELPHYLDLPAFESVRSLGVDSESYRPVQYDDQVLVLCPFGRDYSRLNWEEYLSTELSGKLVDHLRARDADATKDPQIVRLLDLYTPRLVAQTLYEAIRRMDLCIIDWTMLRPNVLYEAGVRLACNRLGAVHIIQELEGRDLSLDRWADLHHVQAMVKLLKPIRYVCAEGHEESYDRMIQQFRSTIDSGGEGLDGLVYRTVGEKYDHVSQPVAIPVVEELVRNANLLLSDDQESTGITPVLYHDVNREILIAAETAAAERRLAAWLYMERRYPDARLRNDPELYTRLRSLAAQARRWLRAQQETELDEYIRDRMTQIRDAKEAES